jgi:hypothetical protein
MFGPIRKISARVPPGILFPRAGKAFLVRKQNSAIWVVGIVEWSGRGEEVELAGKQKGGSVYPDM